MQDVRYVERRNGAPGTLYYNEACHSSAQDAGGRCSYLVAMNPVTKQVLWRTSGRISSNVFLVVDDYLVTAYGSDGERASIRVIRRSDGRAVDVQRLPARNFEMTVAGDVVSIALDQHIGRAHFRMTGFEGASPKLVPLPITPEVDDARIVYDPPLLPERVRDDDDDAPSIALPQDARAVSAWANAEAAKAASRL